MALGYKPGGRGFDYQWFHWNFHLLKPSGRTMALGSTQSLTEMSTSVIFLGVKAAGAKGWQTYHLHVSIVWKSWEPQLPGIFRACPALHRDPLPRIK